MLGSTPLWPILIEEMEEAYARLQRNRFANPAMTQGALKPASSSISALSKLTIGHIVNRIGLLTQILPDRSISSMTRHLPPFPRPYHPIQRLLR